MADRPTAFTETRAFATQATLIARHAFRPEPPAAGQNVVVLVHGFLAAAPVFDPLRARIAQDLGWATLAFGYPSYGDFHATAQRLADTLAENVPEGSAVTLLGHSLGGLLARWYVEELGGAPRVSRLVTVCTPHLGTSAARLAPFGLAGAIRPDSDITRHLASTRDPAGPSLHALAGARDTTVRPTSALGCEADTKHVVAGVGHNGILYAPHAQDHIVRAIAGGERRASGSTDGGSATGSLAS
ncbi:MAG: alpha/beta fold hydrolase [Polyangiales bacterium]|nr:hypothetical protein [Myxococcales bacterium]MCB9659174.1 hypothetical protein [Sandaracinaceae bacterium]